MSETALSVVHVIGPGVSAGRLAAARLICEQLWGIKHTVLLVGRATGRIAWPGATKVRAAFNWARLGSEAIAKLLDDLPGARARSVALHVWSLDALPWVRPLRRKLHRLLIELETGAAAGELPADLPAGAAYVCASERARECLARRGISVERLWLIRDGVDAGLVERAPRTVLRARLGLLASEIAIAILPPLTRAAGAMYATWAGLLLEKIHPEVRLLIPGGAAENRGLRYLVRACRHEHVVRWAEGLSVADLVAAADMAAFTPVSDASLTGLAWAMAAGRPIVASNVPAVTEVLQGGRSAWLCRPQDPQDAARRMLQAIEEPERSTRLAAAAREGAGALFAPQRMVEEYGRMYTAVDAERL